MFKKTATGILAIALVLIPLPSSAKAPGPSYDQTRDWVKVKMDGSSGGRYNGSTGSINFTFHFVSMDSCQLVYRETQDWTGRIADIDAQVVTEITHTVPLSQIGSTKSVLDGGLYLVTLGTSSAPFEARITERASYKSGDDVSVAYEKDAHVEFGQPSTDNHGLAKRFTKAIEHAAGICRLQDAKNNEAF
jgi:hypothetical protein